MASLSWGVRRGYDSEYLVHFKVLIAGCLVLMFVSGCLAVALVLLLITPRGDQDSPR
jgi:hypothetical protein